MISVSHVVPSETNVLLLLGGKSGERDISMSTGAAVSQALKRKGFNVTELDTATEGALAFIESAKPDVVFNCLHGRYGEDGTIQGVCELLGLPNTGSGLLSSALAMDKARAKTMYASADLLTPSGVSLEYGEDYDVEEIAGIVGIPCVVKPSREGSALGVKIIRDAANLANAIEEVFKIDNEILIEEMIQGTEVTVGVLGNKEIEALPVIEIVPENEFYDFDAKYRPGASRHIIPARISDELNEECKRIALEAHRVLGCRGVSRSDLIITAEGECYLLETNTIPGMTATSLLPDAARNVGIEFDDLCELLLNLALED